MIDIKMIDIKTTQKKLINGICHVETCNSKTEGKIRFCKECSEKMVKNMFGVEEEK